MELTLYKKDVSGSIRQWTISSVDDIVSITHGMLGGSMQVKEILVTPKANRSLSEQVMLEMSSRIVKARDTGYVDSYEDAVRNKKTNAINLPLPMLATPYNKIKAPPESYYLQYKYDGNRCLIGKVNGEIIAYSRKGREFDSIDHIKEACKDIPEGIFLDGELYKHGVPLQTLRSWISRKQAESNQLEYICYDAIIAGLSYSKRLERLLNLDLSYPIRIAKSERITPIEGDIEPISSRLNSAIRIGYEGLIIRTEHGEYQDGKRSKHLIKVKKFEDAEFPVVGIKASADGWAILECTTESGKIFSVSAPGTMEDKKEVLNNMERYIGKQVTVEYANITPYGIPFHPVAIAWRNDD